MSNIELQPDDIARQQLIRSIVGLHFIGENPDFEEQVTDILADYIVFRRHRPDEEIDR